MFRWLIYSGLICYLASLFLPVLDHPGRKPDQVLLGHDALWFSYRYGTSGSLGLLVEVALAERDDAKSGMRRMYLRWAGWAWLANLAVAFALIGLFVRSRELLRILAFLCVACVVLAAGGVLIPVFSGTMLEYGLGYWAWIIALCQFSAGLLLAQRAARGRTAAQTNSGE
jgi:hypothetical protein